MTAATKEIISMIGMLPEEEQEFACELMRKLVLAWDPDFTKLTLQEAGELETALQQAKDGECYGDGEIDWDNLDSMELD